MTQPEILLALEGCTSRREAFARVVALIDEYHEQAVRDIAGRMLLDERDVTEIPDCIVQLRGVFAHSRAEALVDIARVFDQVLGSERPEDA